MHTSASGFLVFFDFARSLVLGKSRTVEDSINVDYRVEPFTYQLPAVKIVLSKDLGIDL